MSGTYTVRSVTPEHPDIARVWARIRDPYFFTQILAKRGLPTLEPEHLTGLLVNAVFGEGEPSMVTVGNFLIGFSIGQAWWMHPTAVVFNEEFVIRYCDDRGGDFRQALRSLKAWAKDQGFTHITIGDLAAYTPGPYRQHMDAVGIDRHYTTYYTTL